MGRGIPAEAVLRFLDVLERNTVNMHGFLMLHRGEKIAEGYWKPFAADVPHRMFSVSKSMTSLAIGMLIGEGKVALEDRIAGSFADKLPSPTPERIADMRVRDLLRMASAHTVTAYKCLQDPDWTRAFFTYPPEKDPGAVFAYDSSASQALGALVERVAGRSLLDFLTERLFAPLGCSGEIRWLRDPAGACQGGTGLLMTLPDLARVAACCLRGGDGLVPADYLREATAWQIDTSTLSKREERFGYGYHFWRTRHNGYAMHGIGGQLAIVLPDFDFILCTVADVQLEQGGVWDIFDALWGEVLPYLKGERAPEASGGPERERLLAERLASLRIPSVAHRAEWEEWPERRFHFGPNALGIEWLELSRGELRYRSMGTECALSFGLGEQWQGMFPGSTEPCLVSGGFVAPHVLLLRIHVLGDVPGGAVMQIALNGWRVTVQARSTRPVKLEGFDGVASGEALNAGAPVFAEKE